MATFTERISVIIDTKVDGFSTGLKKIKTDIASADGAVGKLKAGAKGLGDGLSSLVSSGAGIPIIGGYLAGLFKVSTDAADAFSSLAKESIDLAAATGLNTEQASKWIAVADDFGLTAADLQSGLKRIGMDLNSEKWAQYGIATRDAAGKTRQANDIFLDALDVLSKMDNATERANVGAKLFGKGYGSLAPIIGKTRAEYEKMLGAVSAGQTITADEAEKAEEWRLAQDELADAMRDVQLELGQLVVELAPLIKGVSEFTSGALSVWIDKMEQVEQTIADVKATVLTFSYNVRNVMGDTLAEPIAKLQELNAGFDAAHDAGDRGADGISKVSTALIVAHDAGDRGADGLQHFNDEQRHAIRLAVQTKADVDALNETLKAIRDDNSALDLADQFDALQQQSEEAFYATVSGADGAEAAQRDYNRAINDTKLEVADYATEVLGLPESRVTALVTQLDKGNVAWVEQELARITRQRVVGITAFVSYGGGHVTVGNIKRQAAGGDFRRGDAVLSGEKGPELQVMSGNGHTFTKEETDQILAGGRGGGGTTVNHWNVSLVTNNPAHMIRMLKEHMRRNGGVL